MWGWRTICVFLGFAARVQGCVIGFVMISNNSGVYQWDSTSGISSVIPGLKWSTPSLTTDDQLVAYAVGADSTPHVETRVMSSGATAAFAPWRDSPVFVAATTLLVREEAACQCMGGYSATGKTLVIHTDTRAESDLGITGWQFGAFWPRA